MSDELDISGSGSFAVETGELYSSAQTMRAIALEAASLRCELAAIDGLVSLWRLQLASAPASAARAEGDIDQAIIVTHEIELGARAIQWALETAADGYGFVELIAKQLFGEFIGDLGGLFGRALPGLLAGVLPIGSAAVGGIAGAAALNPEGTGAMAEGLQRLSREHNELLTNPLTVALIRQAAMVSDDVLLGASGLPQPLVDLLGDNALGLAGVGLTSAAAMSAGRWGGAFAESDVRLAATRSTTVESAPTGFQDRLGRVPDTDVTDGAQVVIEKYSTPGEPDRFEVYVAGTVTFSPIATTEPWDMTSNMSNAIGPGGGSYDSVAEAMRLAGIDESSPVQFTGYSQGGATVALLASSGDYNTQGLATFGAPAGQVQIPADFPTVMVQHADDLVPALGGTNVNQHAVLVERDVFAGREIPEEYAVPAHHYEYYAETARLMDESSSERLGEAIGRLDSFGAGATTVTSTQYRFERIPPTSDPSGGR